MPVHHIYRTTSYKAYLFAATLKAGTVTHSRRSGGSSTREKEKATAFQVGTSVECTGETRGGCIGQEEMKVTKGGSVTSSVVLVRRNPGSTPGWHHTHFSALSWGKLNGHP